MDIKNWVNTTSVFMVVVMVIAVIGLVFLATWANQIIWNYVFGQRITTFTFWETMAVMFLAAEFGSFFKK